MDCGVCTAVPPVPEGVDPVAATAARDVKGFTPSDPVFALEISIAKFPMLECWLISWLKLLLLMLMPGPVAQMKF